MGVPVKTLALKRAQTVPAEEQLGRFKALMSIYTDADGSPAVMSDVTARTDAMLASPLMSPCAPALYFLMIMGKVGPWTEQLGRTWSKAFVLQATRSGRLQCRPTTSKSTPRFCHFPSRHDHFHDTLCSGTILLFTTRVYKNVLRQSLLKDK